MPPGRNPLDRGRYRQYDAATTGDIILVGGSMSSVLRIDETDVRILILMRDGFSDASISRKLSRGHRTIQRRIGQMMDQFGVSGRFALGVRVAELNLLAPAEMAGDTIGMTDSAPLPPR